MLRSRIGSLIFLSVLLVCGLTGRLFYISVGGHTTYLAQAEEQQSVEKDVLPKRGEIYIQDRSSGKSVLVAKSAQRFALSVTPLNVVYKEEYAALLAKESGLAESDLLETLKANGKYVKPLKHGLTKDDIERILTEINILEKTKDKNHADFKINFDAAQGNIIYALGGVFFIREFQRVYPEDGTLSQVLGFVNDDGVGQYGFEGQFDKQLKGYSGKLKIERDSLGTLLDRKSAINGQDGLSYELSIDRTVQAVVEKELQFQIQDSESEGGSVIVMNPKNGEIVAMANYPTFNVPQFRDVAAKDIYLFDNPAVSYVWEPGSIFKPLVMSMALDLNLVTPQTKGTFGASVTVDNHVINTALRKAYGEETMTQVLANSDNVAMVWVAEKIGNPKMYEYLQKFGFGDYTGVDLKNEIPGRLTPLQEWRNINRATIAFGQGIAVTPLQIASAYSAIANNGRKVQPHIVHATILPDGTREETKISEGEQIIKPEVAKELRDMMVATVLTAHNRAGTPGYKIGGKTGTAQIPDPVKGGYIEDAYNHSFIGIGPSDDPQYVLLVKLDHPNLKKVGLFAESTAVPLFGRISSFLLNYYQIPPTNR